MAPDDVTLLCNENFTNTHCYPVQNPEELADPLVQTPGFVPITTVYSITLVLGLFGSTVVIFTLLVDRKSKNVTSSFLVSLAVADLLMLLIIVPYEITYMSKPDLKRTDVICKSLAFVKTLSAMGSVMNLTAVSLERFVVIVYPMHSRTTCTMRNAVKSLMCTWILAMLLSTPMITLNGLTGVYIFYNNVTSVSLYQCSAVTLPPWQEQAFAYYYLFVMFLIPTVVMTGCYIVVIEKLWTSTRSASAMACGRHNLQAMNDTNSPKRIPAVDSTTALQSAVPLMVDDSPSRHSHSVMEVVPVSESGQSTPVKTARSTSNFNPNLPGSDEAILKARKQVIKMLIAVVIIFVICWGPKLVLDVIRKSQTDGKSFSQVDWSMQILKEYLPVVHSCFNPFIYAFMSRNFRHSMARAFTRCCRRRTVIRQSTKSRDTGSLKSSHTSSSKGSTVTSKTSSHTSDPCPTRRRAHSDGVKNARDCIVCPRSSLPLTYAGQSAGGLLNGNRYNVSRIVKADSLSYDSDKITNL